MGKGKGLKMKKKTKKTNRATIGRDVRVKALTQNRGEKGGSVNPWSKIHTQCAWINFAIKRMKFALGTKCKDALSTGL